MHVHATRVRPDLTSPFLVDGTYDGDGCKAEIIYSSFVDDVGMTWPGKRDV